MCGYYAGGMAKEIPILGHTCNRVACYDDAEIIICNDVSPKKLTSIITIYAHTYQKLFAVTPSAADISAHIGRSSRNAASQIKTVLISHAARNLILKTTTLF
jgi:ribosomal protein L7Ae-like RNA K-turn-binding protein